VMNSSSSPSFHSHDRLLVFWTGCDTDEQKIWHRALNCFRRYFLWNGIRCEVLPCQQVDEARSLLQTDHPIVVVLIPKDNDFTALKARFADQLNSVTVVLANSTSKSFMEPSDPTIFVHVAGNHICFSRIQSNELTSRLMEMFCSLHLAKHYVLLSRHGESESNAIEQIGGNAELTAKGKRFAIALGEYLRTRNDWISGGIEIWTSHLKRAVNSCEQLKQYWPCRNRRILNEIHAGEHESLTYEEIRQKFPQEYAARSSDKLRYRYPSGESYLDVIERVRPIVLELQRTQKTVLVVSHQGVLRTLYGYFCGANIEQIPHLTIPTETIIELTLSEFECTERRFQVPVL